MTPEEQTLAVQVWTKIVSTQEHFNTLILQVRNHLLTILTAVLGGVGVALTQHYRVTLFSKDADLTTVILFVGFLILIPFYITEKGYHHLLVGAVKQAIDLETKLKDEIPGIALSTRIKEESHSRIFFVIHQSADRIRWFYSILGVIFLLATVLTWLGAASPPKAQDVSIKTALATSLYNLGSHATNNEPNYLPNDPSQGTRALKAFYNSGSYYTVFSEITASARDYIDRTLPTIDVNKEDIAIFDIDDTALSTWEILNKGDFTWDPQRFRDFVLGAKCKRLEPALSLFNYLRSHNIPVVFVTSRSDDLREATERNLKDEGFVGYQQLIMRPSDSSDSAKVFKDRIRTRLRDAGKSIVLSIGDHLEDLDFTNCRGNFLLPDPFY